MLGKVIISLAVGEILVQTREIGERHEVYSQARKYADAVGKPLLVVGTPKTSLSHPCGDVTIDLHTGRVCDTKIADIRSIPYPDHYFGAALCSHVLEHLSTIDDAFLALAELDRTADQVFIVSPHKNSIAAWFHPGHHLWVTSTGDGYVIEQRGNPPKSQEKCYRVALQVM